MTINIQIMTVIFMKIKANKKNTKHCCRTFVHQIEVILWQLNTIKQNGTVLISFMSILHYFPWETISIKSFLVVDLFKYKYITNKHDLKQKRNFLNKFTQKFAFFYWMIYCFIRKFHEIGKPAYTNIYVWHLTHENII